MRRPVVALLVDAVCVLAFAAVGTRTHAGRLTVTAAAETAWPFLAGAGVGWLLCRAWRRPLDIVPTGVVVWLATVVVGMLVRRATGEGTATAFVVVASVVTAVLLLGWRALARFTRT